MIRYTLSCADDHQFESWFQSSEAYESLRDAGHVTCAVCGSADVHRAPMAPRIGKGQEEAPDNVDAPALSATRSEIERAMAEMRAQVEANSDYVGLSFVQEARDMHDGLKPERSIYGEAKPEDARKLIEEGIPVAPLPFVPKRKTN